MSKRLSLPILIAAAWLITVIAGFMAGRRSSPEAEAASGPGAASLSDDARPTRPGRAEVSAPRRENRGTARNGSAPPTGRLSDILGDLDHNERSRRFLDYIARLSDEEFANLASELTTGPMAEMNRHAYSMLLTEWAARDPYAAAEYVQAYAKDDWERETLLAAWGARDPQAAFDWAASAGDEGDVNNWISGAMKGIAAADPQLARRLLEGMEDGPTRRHALQRSATAIAALGAETAGDWLARIADDDFRRRATRTLAGPLARGDAIAAGTWVAGITDVSSRRDASKVVSEHWARNDLDGAKQWVESLPEDTRTEAAEGVAGQLGRVDPQQGAEWLLSLGDNPDLDGARQRFLDSAARGAPEVAANMVSSLSSQKARTGYYYRVLGRWTKSDKVAARSWVNDNADVLPQEIVKRMTK